QRGPRAELRAGGSRPARPRSRPPRRAAHGSRPGGGRAGGGLRPHPGAGGALDMGGPEMAPLITWGPRHGPQTPERSGRPGGAVAPLYTPNARSPRETRGAPRSRAQLLDHAPSTRRNHELMSAISSAHTECSIG